MAKNKPSRSPHLARGVCNWWVILRIGRSVPSICIKGRMASGGPLWNWNQARITIASSWTVNGVMILNAPFARQILMAAKT